MFKTERVSEFATFLRTLLVGGVLGAAGVMALLLFGPQWFRGLFLSKQPQLVPSPVVFSTSSASPNTQAGAPSPEMSPVIQTPVKVAFEDIKGSFGEKEITQLAQLGVFDATTGKFNPTQPITRAEFLRWLVRANNAIWFDLPDKMVREAEGGQATFADVPPTHPDFRYIQGVANAGIAVGYDEKSFQPDRPLTREQMIAIKVGLDYGGINNPNNETFRFDAVPVWTDRDQISKRFVAAFNMEYFGPGFWSDPFKNVDRTFGVIKTLKPQSPVTRAEAAVCISLIGNHLSNFTDIGKFRTAELALQIKAEQGNTKTSGNN